MASAARSNVELPLFFPLLISACFLLPCFVAVHAQGTSSTRVQPPHQPASTPHPPFSFSFNFSDSNPSSFLKSGDLRLEGNATATIHLIDLTCAADSNGVVSNNCAGRVSYAHPVPFHDASGAMASFSTSFTFAIGDGGSTPGDGMAFFLTGFPSKMMPAYYEGGNLGLISEDTSTAFVAVEFDTFQNSWDPNDNHMGVDVNTLVSSNTTSTVTLPPLNGTMTATVTFDNVTRVLKASLWFHDYPSVDPAVVSYVLQDPKSLLPSEVEVGFSAATGSYTELHQILAWSFNSTLAAPTPAPAPARVAPPAPTLPPKNKGKMNVSKEDEALASVVGRNSEFNVYDFLQILEATNNFSEENKLGQGGFGPVYKGQLHDGSEIAVKRLASHSGQGFREFKNEIELIAKLQHTNLVRLLGCCSQGDERLLVYEYLPNKSLDFYIFDEIKGFSLDWNKRLVIIEGIAQGILYLHKHSRLRVIHRDLKASNILLDSEMNPKISDFGLAKIFGLNDTEGNTKRIVGTYGYMAPEYASEGLFSTKSDVFSFGVLSLEIISGKRTSSSHQYGEFINLLGYAWQLRKDGLWIQLVDSSLGADEWHTLQIRRCINIALLCVQENAVDRPTMSEVVAMLSSDSMTLPEPKYPAYFHVRVGTEEASAEVETSGVNDVTVSAQSGR
ncbi:hypothetical protein HU200_034483 [Digitaria exilis]|uniref:non-specific serine/threonine protein kinase n=1 Tax=Digitaria exilis TaxID=1010633 RepID=A0A835BKG7_9POAL|nr:hypothetical protein HU200_034483 [Digitaria exilis]